MTALACESTVMCALGYTPCKIAAARSAEMICRLITIGGFGVGDGVGRACAAALTAGALKANPTQKSAKDNANISTVI